ncbi:MAG: zinc ribbon domain-containing protein [Eggerthellaceae bacterium]|nr:zinc ribbon domain-containing protein [Eggerthellaceae bacterium]
MYCWNCGSPVNDGDRFCKTCGVSLGNENTAISPSQTIGKSNIVAQAEPETETLKAAVENGRRDSHRKLPPLAAIILAMALAAGAAFAATYVYQNIIKPQQEATEGTTRTEQVDTTINSSANDAYHVSTDYYEFDIPEYWRDRVKVEEDNQQIDVDDHVSGKIIETYYSILTISLSDTDTPWVLLQIVVSTPNADIGDVINVAQYTTSDGKQVAVLATDWIEEAYENQTGNLNAEGYPDNDLQELLDLSTGGTVSLEDCRANGNATVDSTPVTDFLINNLLPSIKIK